MELLARALMVAGASLALIGLLIYLGPSIPWLGRLPGDLRFERPGLRIVVPLTTCILLSAVLSVIIYLLSKLR